MLCGIFWAGGMAIFWGGALYGASARVLGWYGAQSAVDGIYRGGAVGIGDSGKGAGELKGNLGAAACGGRTGVRDAEGARRAVSPPARRSASEPRSQPDPERSEGTRPGYIIPKFLFL